jgi:hypothetical protein
MWVSWVSSMMIPSQGGRGVSVAPFARSRSKSHHATFSSRPRHGVETCAHALPAASCAPMLPLVSEAEAIRDFILAFGRRLPDAPDRLMVSPDSLDTPILKWVVTPWRDKQPRVEQTYHIAWVDRPSSKNPGAPFLQLDVEERPLQPLGSGLFRDNARRVRLVLSPEGEVKAVYEAKGLAALRQRELAPEDRERVKNVQHAIDSYYDKNWEGMVTPIFPVYKPTPASR